MDTLFYFYFVPFWLFVYGDGNMCTPKHQTFYESSTFAENTYANFSYQLTNRIGNTTESDFRIEVKLCEIASLYIACRCIWISKIDPVCKILKNDSICEANNSEMHLSLLVKRTYSDAIWVIFQQNTTPIVLKHTVLQVTYSAKITGLYVNGEDTNGTLIAHENQEVNISCFFTNGSPLVNIRILDNTGHTLSSTKYGNGPLTLSLGAYHCQDVWPVIRCEAAGSEINRSVAIVFRCPPQLSYLNAKVTDLRKLLDEGLTFAMKAHTRVIKKCLMIQLQSRNSAKEVNCDVRGNPPEFTLILRLFNESWIGEGIWTLQIMNELGASSITFHLINSTGMLVKRDKIQFEWLCTPCFLAEICVPKTSFFGGIKLTSVPKGTQSTCKRLFSSQHWHGTLIEIAKLDREVGSFFSNTCCLLPSGACYLFLPAICYPYADYLSIKLFGLPLLGHQHQHSYESLYVRPVSEVMKTCSESFGISQ